ncbi:hypothetical protein [Bacillus pumilus]|nr:hypothetical protein [Bacillus pumilus]
MRIDMKCVRRKEERWGRDMWEVEMKGKKRCGKYGRILWGWKKWGLRIFE